MIDAAAAVAADVLSQAPDERAREDLLPFEPLIGSWRARYRYRSASGANHDVGGYVNFAWGLNGRAIVDIWAAEGRGVGTTIRFYDSTIGAFRSTWICPSLNVVIPFIGRVVDGRIVLMARRDDPPERRLRWSFLEIARERFRWTGEVSEDGGATWLLTQEIDGTREG